MVDAAGTSLIPHTEIEGVLAGSVDLYHADLNADGEEDYVAATCNGGLPRKRLWRTRTAEPSRQERFDAQR